MNSQRGNVNAENGTTLPSVFEEFQTQGGVITAGSTSYVLGNAVSDSTEEIATKNMTILNGSYAAASWSMGDFIWIYTPIVIGFGAVGNILCFLILRRSKLKLQPLIQIIFAVCISDTMFLLCLLILWMRTLGVEIYRVAMGCQFLSLLTQITNFLSTWLMAMLAVERYITVSECTWFRCLRQGRDQFGRLRSDKTKCTVIKTRMAILGVLITAVVVYVNLTITVDVFEHQGTLVCAPSRMFESVLPVLTVLDILFNVLLPYLLIALLTILTCQRSVRFYFSRKRAITRRGLASCSRHLQPGFLCPKSELRLTKMAVIWSIVYMTLTAPTQAMRVLQGTRGLFNLPVQFSYAEYFWQQVFHCCYHLSFSTNLAVIVATHGGFRQALRGTAADSCRCLHAALPHRCRRGDKNRNLRLNAVSFPLEFSSTLARMDDATFRL